MARECYSASVKQKVVDNVYIDELDMPDEVITRPEPSAELEPVSLDDDPEHLAYIDSKLAEDLKGLLTQFLRQNKDVFAWKQADMGGIDPAVDHTRSTDRRDSLLNGKCEKKMRVDFRILENPSPRRNNFALESPLTFIFIFKWGKPSKNKKPQ